MGNRAYLDGVQKIKGKFKSGSVVRLMDSQGTEIGLGIVNYSSVQLQEPEKKKELINKALIDQEAFVCHVDLLCLLINLQQKNPSFYKEDQVHFIDTAPA